MSPDESFDHLWKYADASWCQSRGHDPRVEARSHCRWTVWSGVGGPKPGHEGCEPLLTGEGIKRLLFPE